jgi:hypothetical protein
MLLGKSTRLITLGSSVFRAEHICRVAPATEGPQMSVVSLLSGERFTVAEPFDSAVRKWADALESTNQKDGVYR